jgi:hypothetical protein
VAGKNILIPPDGAQCNSFWVFILYLTNFSPIHLTFSFFPSYTHFDLYNNSVAPAAIIGQTHWSVGSSVFILLALVMSGIWFKKPKDGPLDRHQVLREKFNPIQSENLLQVTKFPRHHSISIRGQHVAWILFMLLVKLQSLNLNPGLRS